MYETLCRATIRTFDLFGALAVSGLWWTACNNRCATLHRLSFIRRSCFQRHFGFVAAQCVTIFKSTTLLQQRRIQAGGGGGVWGLQPPLSYMVTPPLLLNSPPFPAFCIGPEAPDSIPPPPPPPPSAFRIGP